ncbi:molybdopterin biosynthesis protein [Thioclava dalianensis]|uniref:Molybdopterin-synthase adenylyltransferase n=1 Tax=Thioclava dalianensis TaxID=1185766 RepID=A0A074TEH8_9RHOB|nr:molybdopterin-synthase adenylyltransferase MoeB [Thioclava dalianensis]KEP70156.1 molybdopterin biosynthesis protein [Thioclava dalianensis]SFM80691.1 Molybdopterin or thiamine biosynthesis adenylyltransferase [Thioclava dalianensis]
MLGLTLLAALAVLGWVMKASARAIWVMLAVIWLALVLAHLPLPGFAPLGRVLGGSLAGWLWLGAVSALVLGYRRMLRAIRARVPEPDTTAAPTRSDQFSGAELDRYSRHIMLREIGGPGQKRLRQAKVLVIGAGGLGAPVLLYLAAAGVGRIGVIDDDTVSNSNLQRQVIHRDADIGAPKVASARAALEALNPHIEILTYERRLSAEDAPELIAQFDLVIDGSDNFETRYLVNAACVASATPLISGAITQWEGQLSLYDPARGAPCYACLFPQAPAPGLAPSCAEAGVVGALPGVIGAMMATEAIKEITGAGQTARGRLMIHDALWGESRQIKIKRDPNCPVCAALDTRADPA